MHARWKAAGRFLWKHWPSTALAVFALGVIMTPHALERRFVYYPDKNVAATPSSVGLTYRDLSLETTDHVKLHGWYVPHPSSTVTLLIFHGNAGNMGDRVPWMEMLHETGAGILIIDYRGYGNSEGDPHEAGLYRDAQTAHEWWRKERGHAGEKLVLVGESIGGAVAVDLAARVPVAGLIVQSTFTNAWDVAKTILPLGLLQPLAGVHFDSAAKIAGIRCPKLFIHGSRDEIVPCRLGRKLYELSPPPKEFYEVQGAGHNDLPWVAGPQYVVRIRNFLHSL
ncbi:MAG: hypothetical protein DMG08_06735 [Acidobacteria bacterium]|nr:MAG: hypothetical protein DMG08_06735 [Acidobacteriota bacterium]